MKVACAACEAVFESSKPNARFCSSACRSRSYRARTRGAEPTAPEPVEPVDGLVASVRRDLAAAGRLESTYGQLALVLAKQSTRADATGVQGLSKELTRVLALALDGASTPAGDADDAPDEVDEVQRRRDAKARKAAGTA